MKHRTFEKKNSTKIYMANITKKARRIQLRKWNNAIFRFIVTELQAETFLAKVSSFLIKKNNLEQRKHTKYEKKCGNLLVKINNIKHVENPIKIKVVYYLKCNVYAQEIITLQRELSETKLSLATP